MTDPDETVHMTPAEISLYREILRWCRNHGVTPIHFAWGRTWRRVGDLHTPVVAWERRSGDPAIGLCTTGGQPYQWHGAANLTRAVDILVAYGFLPPRFASAYGAGWHAAETWYAGGDADDPPEHRAEFARLFHDPLNVSMPVGSDA